MPRVSVSHMSPRRVGFKRVALDVKDGPSRIEIKLSQPQILNTPAGPMMIGASGWTELCISPCVVDLPAGAHQLSFRELDGDRKDTDTIRLVHDASVYRRALGEYSDSPVLAGAGYFLFFPGVLTFLTGLGALVAGSHEAGAIVTGVGGGLTLAGGLMWYFGIPSKQDGATTHYPVNPRRLGKY